MEFISAEELIIKDEPDLKEGKYADGVAAETFIPEIYETKCGEILVSNKANFLLICAFCDENFTNMRGFGEHMGKHLNIDSANTLETRTHSPTKKYYDDSNAVQAISEAIDAIDDIRDETNNEGTSDRNESINSNINKKTRLVKFWCDICKKEFSTKFNLKRHMLLHKETNSAKIRTNKIRSDADRLKCRYCGKQLTDKAKLSDHERIHTNERPYKCPHCPKSFKISSSFKSHINFHTRARPHKCSFCTKSFTNYSTFMTHKRRLHLGIKKYACEISGQQFVRKTEKKIHKKTHFGELPYQCEICGKRFIIGNQLYEHRKQHSNVLDFKWKEIYSKNSLHHHQVVHSELMQNTHLNIDSVNTLEARIHSPAKCYDDSNAVQAITEATDSIFDIKDDMNNDGTSDRIESINSNINKKTELFKFWCDICKKKFSRKFNLKRHMLRHKETNSAKKRIKKPI